MTTTHRVEALHPGRTVCCDTSIKDLPPSAHLAFTDGQHVTCPGVNTADNLHLGLALALNRSSSVSNKELLAEVTRNGVQLAGHKQARIAAMQLVVAIIEDLDNSVSPRENLQKLVDVLDVS